MTQLRSLTREQDRAKALMALALQHGVTLPTGDALKEHIEKARSPWRNGIPLGFDEFTKEVAGVTLFDRQVDILDKPNLLRAESLFSLDRSITVWHLVFGKGSGKDMLASLFLVWIAYVLSQFRENPRHHLAAVSGKSIADSTAIDLVNVSVSEVQAVQVFFGYVKNWLRSPLFKDIEIYPKAEQTKPGTNHIMLVDANVHLYSKSSKAGAVEGFQTLGFVVDEGDSMTDSLGQANADLLYDTLHRTAIGRWGRCSVGLNISYGKYDEGFMLRREAEFLASNAKMLADGKKPMYYVDKAGTNEVRPDFDLDSEEIKAEFEIDPEGASAMYLNKPMAGAFAFFHIEGTDLSDWVDDSRPQICDVIETRPSHASRDGIERDYVCVEIESIERQPGATYFLTIDGGLSQDSYALCVGHIDTSEDAVEWLCPQCAVPEVMGAAKYRKLQWPEPETLSNPIKCGMCGGLPVIITPVMGNRGWYQREGGEGKSLVLGGKSFNVPHVYEDLLIDVQPEKANAHSRKRREVFLPGMHEQTQKLIMGLGIEKVRTDPWQTIEMIQSIHSETGIDIDKMSFSQPDQLKRALLYKFYLNNHLFTLRSNARRDKECRQLQRKGMKIDHPEGGSKDLWDSESMLVFLAATHVCSEIALYL